MQIQETKDYSRFFIRKDNREINQATLKKLIKSIQKHDLLAYNPILINERNEIIDGQHRYFAAKRLHKTIYYLVIDKAALEDILLLNTAMKNWSSLDYLHAYCELGNTNYIILREFYQQTKFSLRIAGILLAGLKGTGDNITNFKDGGFIAGDMEKALHRAQCLQSFKNFDIDKCIFSRDFIRAFMSVFDKIPMEDIVRQLEKYSLKIKRQGSTKKYVQQFEDIYNFRKSKNAIRLY